MALAETLEAERQRTSGARIELGRDNLKDEPRILFGRGEDFYGVIAGEGFGYTGKDNTGNWVYLGISSLAEVRVSAHNPHRILCADKGARIRNYRRK